MKRENPGTLRFSKKIMTENPKSIEGDEEAKSRLNLRITDFAMRNNMKTTFLESSRGKTLCPEPVHDPQTPQKKIVFPFPRIH